jgi:hypothetical protein
MKFGVKTSFFKEKQNLHQNTKPKKPLFFREKNETFVELRSQSVKPSSKYEAKETFIKIRSQV